MRNEDQKNERNSNEKNKFYKQVHARPKASEFIHDFQLWYWFQVRQKMHLQELGKVLMKLHLDLSLKDSVHLLCPEYDRVKLLVYPIRSVNEH